MSIAASPRPDKSGDGATVTAVTIGKNQSTTGPALAGRELNAGACAPGIQHEPPLTAAYTL
jgi:hypothetical protein